MVTQRNGQYIGTFGCWGHGFESVGSSSTLGSSLREWFWFQAADHPQNRTTFERRRSSEWLYRKKIEWRQKGHLTSGFEPGSSKSVIRRTATWATIKVLSRRMRVISFMEDFSSLHALPLFHFFGSSALNSNQIIGASEMKISAKLSRDIGKSFLLQLFVTRERNSVHASTQENFLRGLLFISLSLSLSLSLWTIVPGVTEMSRSGATAATFFRWSRWVEARGATR